jgi:hypothetical protein
VKAISIGKRSLSSGRNQHFAFRALKETSTNMEKPNNDQQKTDPELLEDPLSDDYIEILDSPVGKTASSKPAVKTRKPSIKPEIPMAPVFSQMGATANTSNLKRKRSSVGEPSSKDSDRDEKHKESRWQSGGQSSGSSSTRVDPLKAVQP